MRDSNVEHGAQPERPRYRPPIGMPLERPPRWGALVSVAVHALLVLLLISPALIIAAAPDVPQGAGGPGPAGGGGGGRGGSGGGRDVVERLEYMQVAPAEAQPEVVPPVEEVLPEPEVEPEKTVTEPIVQLDIKAPTTRLDMALTAGIGGGTGSDGSSGTGPGTGGGVGSGVGTGRGSSVGAGTGGGEGQIYPPTPDFLTVPPMPKPRKVSGETVQLSFEVDERGNVVRFTFTPTSDRDYNRRIREQFSEVRFRPAVRWDGVPVAATAVLTLRL